MRYIFFFLFVFTPITAHAGLQVTWEKGAWATIEKSMHDCVLIEAYQVLKVYQSQVFKNKTHEAQRKVYVNRLKKRIRAHEKTLKMKRGTFSKHKAVVAFKPKHYQLLHEMVIHHLEIAVHSTKKIIRLLKSGAFEDKFEEQKRRKALWQYQRFLKFLQKKVKAIKNKLESRRV